MVVVVVVVFIVLLLGLAGGVAVVVAAVPSRLEKEETACNGTVYFPKKEEAEGSDD